MKYAKSEVRAGVAGWRCTHGLCLFQRSPTYFQILTLKRMFDRMDADGSGAVDFNGSYPVRGCGQTLVAQATTLSVPVSPLPTEFARSLNERMLMHMRGMFNVLDKDQSGSITFPELLAELYPYATATEMEQMLHWVEKKKLATSVPSFRLTEPQIAELKALFDMYDLNRSGSTS